jgi:Tol biopolymer transport system component
VFILERKMSDKKNKSQYLRRSNDLQERSCSEVQGSPRRRRLEYNKDTSQPENKRRRLSGRDSSPEIFLVSEPQPPTPKKPTPSSSKEPSFSPLGKFLLHKKIYRYNILFFRRIIFRRRKIPPSRCKPRIIG